MLQLNTELVHALGVQEEDEDHLARGQKETTDAKRRRILREGRFGGMSFVFPSSPSLTKPVLPHSATRYE